MYHLPVTRMAREELGREIVANIVALGAIVAITGIVERESIEAAVLGRVPKGTEEINMKALKLGYAAVEGLVATGTASA